VVDPIGSDSAFPAEPVPPRVFLEDVIPALFADLDLSPAERVVELRLGVVLQGEAGGEPGGEWTLHFVDGELGIESTRRPDCDITLVQRVADWRSALWSGRPAFVSDAVQTLFAGSGAGSAPSVLPFTLVPDPRALEELRRLRGCLEIRVEAGEGSPAADDWRLGLCLGPGPIPAAPDATVQLGADQADAIHRGRLHPLEALMTGELRLEGDLGLILQIQAIALTASLPR
jgi:hypothetical protein